MTDPKPGDWFRAPRPHKRLALDSEPVLDALAEALAPRVATILGAAPAPASNLVTIAEFMRLTGASRTTIYHAIQRNELRTFRVGKRIWLEAPEAR